MNIKPQPSYFHHRITMGMVYCQQTLNTNVPLSRLQLSFFLVPSISFGRRLLPKIPEPAGKGSFLNLMVSGTNVSTGTPVRNYTIFFDFNK